MSKNIIFLTVVSFLLGACLSSTDRSYSSVKDTLFDKNNSEKNDVGPKISNNTKAQTIDNFENIGEIGYRDLSLVIPSFDPGNVTDNKDVFPELRNFESRRFAVKLKYALEESEKLGAIRVTPDRTALGEIYVLGTILESNGYTVKVNIQLIDISGKKLMDTNFSKKIKENQFKNVRFQNKDAYNELYTDIAGKIIERLEKLKSKNIKNLKYISDLRFASVFSPESFLSYLDKKKNRYELIALPSEDDPMWKRISSIKIREQLFIDSLQSHYDGFVSSSNQSYTLWQKQSFNEIKASKKARNKAIGRGVLGILSITAAIASSTHKNQNDYDYTNEIGLATLGGKLIEDAIKYKEEAKMHRESVIELNQSIDAEMAPNIIGFENKTQEITGNAQQQFLEWRKFLQKIYKLEKTPDINL